MKKIRKSSEPIMRIKCPYCGCEYDIRVTSFKHSKSKCVHCCNTYENSFAYYIRHELNESLNEYWDWEKNTVNPYLINRWSKINIWLKCEYDNVSYETTACNFYKRKQALSLRKSVNRRYSFAQYHIDNTDANFLEKYWSDKNTVDPWELKPSSNIKVWIRDCNNKEKQISCNHLKYRYKNKTISFKSTISFAQYGIDNICKDFLEKYWSDKNTLDPWKISSASDDKVWIKCQEKDYHDDYLVTCYKFNKRGYRCPQCSHKGTSLHPKDSFAGKYPYKLKYWSDKNKMSPFEVYPHSREISWMICEECGNEFEATMETLNSNKNNYSHVWCKKCNASKGELEIINYLNDRNIKYFYDKQYFKDLLSLKGNPLRPDFILPDYNVWIEFDGEQHYRITTWQTEDEFQTLKKHDKLKDKYAKEHGWMLIRISYKDINYIEDILDDVICKIVS